MDYRKPAIFGENWSPSRYKVLPYFAPEKVAISQPNIQAILEIGCANGWNMSRFQGYGKQSVGLDVEPERLKHAKNAGNVLLASGLQLPFPANHFDFIYIQHVLHHIGNPEQALSEIYRCLKPNALFFLVETVENNPLIRWGRNLHPYWMNDPITARFDYTQLTAQLENAGFMVKQSELYSILFWLWETLPDRYASFEQFTPAFVRLEQLLQKKFNRQSAHAYWMTQKITGDA